jgi:hypothetical protein
MPDLRLAPAKVDELLRQDWQATHQEYGRKTKPPTGVRRARAISLDDERGSEQARLGG